MCMNIMFRDKESNEELFHTIKLKRMSDEQLRVLIQQCSWELKERDKK